MDHKLVSAKGGRMTKRKYNEKIVIDGRKVNKHYSEIGKRGGKAKLKMYGVDYFKKLSALGVAARVKKAQAKKGIIQKVVEAVASI